MKNKIIKITFLLLFITAIFANYRLIYSNDRISDIGLFSLTTNASADDGEGTGGPYLKQACWTCTTSYGQQGVQFGCELSPYCCDDCTFVQSCGYGYC